MVSSFLYARVDEAERSVLIVLSPYRRELYGELYVRELYVPSYVPPEEHLVAHVNSQHYVIFIHRLKSNLKNGY